MKIGNRIVAVACVFGLSTLACNRAHQSQKDENKSVSTAAQVPAEPESSSLKQNSALSSALPDESVPLGETSEPETPSLPVMKPEHALSAPGPGFPAPIPGRKLTFKSAGTSAEPAIRLQDGRVFRLTPHAEIEKFKENHRSPRPEDFSELMKNTVYRDALFGVGKAPKRYGGGGEGAFLLPRPGLLPELFASFMGIRTVFAEPAPGTGFADLSAYVTLNEKGEFRDQMGRDTCQTFAAVATVESMYVRDFKLSKTQLDLSEHFAAHLQKATFLDIPRYGIHESQTSFWGGGNTIHTTDMMKTYSVPAESQAPYINKPEQIALAQKILTPTEFDAFINHPDSMTQQVLDKFEWSEEHIPQAAREHAIYRVKSYASLWPDDVRDPAVLESWLNKGFPVAIAIPWGAEYEVDGIAQYNPALNIGDHAVMVVGYMRTSADDKKNCFIIKNSWGGTTYDHLSYDYIKTQGNIGSVVTAVVDPNQPVPYTTRWLGRWNLSNDGWRGTLDVRRMARRDTPFKEGKSFRLGTYYPEDGRPEKTITAVASESGRTLTYFESDDVNVSEDSRAGRSFILNLFSWDGRMAAGYTVWNKEQYGVVLARDSLPSLGGGAADEEGWKNTSWSLNLDGWKGTLNIQDLIAGKKASSAKKVTGTYTAIGQAPVGMSGSTLPGHPHLLDLKFSGKSVRVMRFSREPGRLAGMTTDKRHYGLSAERK